MVHLEIKPNIYDCSVCHTPCNSESAKQNIFHINETWGDKAEELVLFHINKKGKYRAKLTRFPYHYPDLTLFRDNKAVSFVEVKMVSSTFMKIQTRLPDADLFPSEVVVLNNSAIQNYKTVANVTNMPIYIAFIVANRPCITKEKTYRAYYQDFKVIYQLYKHFGKDRSHSRKIVHGDLDHNGKIQNPLFKVHFSINELIPFEL